MMPNLLSWDVLRCRKHQGRSQTLNLEWTRKEKIIIFFLILLHFKSFFLNFSPFSSSIWSSWWVAPGKALATPLGNTLLTSWFFFFFLTPKWMFVHVSKDCAWSCSAQAMLSFKDVNAHDWLEKKFQWHVTWHESKCSSLTVTCSCLSLTL